ncbi:MAG: phosphoenolpyruvate-protein phosphotransferase [Chloroflexi bacterium]|nr:phosphoenolpyruvate-protein phosphotransferase [Chloroflexota bacterium]
MAPAVRFAGRLAGNRHGAAQVLPSQERPHEVLRLHGALTEAAGQLEALSTDLRSRTGAAEAAVFEAQALFLHDPALLAPIEAAILEDGLQAELAIDVVFEDTTSTLETLEDSEIRARAADLRDVQQRLIAILSGDAPPTPGTLVRDTIVVAPDLLPSETAGLASDMVRGIVLAGGAPAAHVAILARGLGIPLVVGAGDTVLQVAPGRETLLDGSTGLVLVEPDEVERTRYLSSPPPPIAAPGPSASRLETGDGRRVRLFANVGSRAEAELALRNGAEGIGLLRTEFLLATLASSHGAVPGEDALAAAYGEIYETMAGLPVVVRAMDAGGDKPLPFLDFGQEANPALGWRGIRVLLDQPDLFAAQTRALFQAAAIHDTDIRLMLPLISNLDEFRRAREIVEQVRQEAGSTLQHQFRLGVMVEVPAAALTADALAREAEFFSIGTNDLAQYTLACDRGNPRVAQLYQVLHPAVLRLIEMSVRAAHAMGRTAAVCGEAAADPDVVPLLIGLGVDELSVGAAKLPAVRQLVRSLDYVELRPRAAEALTLATADEVRALLAR